MVVTLYLERPRDTIPSLPLVDPHNIVYRGKDTGEVCPVSLMRMPLSQHNRDLLGQRYEVWRKRRPDGSGVMGRGTPLPEHALTPHPVQDHQWFVHRPKTEVRPMASAGEVKAAIGMANLALAQGMQLARQAAVQFAEAKAILGGVRQDTQQELGLLVAGEALTAVEDAQRYGLAAVELNSSYEATL